MFPQDGLHATGRDELLLHIAAIEAEIPSLEIQINETKLLFDTLCQQRQAIVARANRYKQLLAPINKLPVELLTNIFLISYSCRPRIAVQSIFSQVCQCWRSIAIGTPELWSKPWLCPLNAETTIAHLRHVNPKVFPATLSISPPRVNWHSLSKLFWHAPSRDVIREIALLDVHPMHFGKIFPSSISPASQLEQPLPYPLLRSFCARANGAARGAAGQCLRPTAIVGIPWPQLTHIHFDFGMSVGDAKWLLITCTQLQESTLTLSNEHDALQEYGKGKLVVLAFLRTLKLVVVPTELECAGLIDALTLPALNMSWIEMVHNQLDMGVCFVALKERSSMDLQFFSAMNAWFTTAMLVDFLQDMPSLVVIELMRTEDCINKEFMEALASYRVAPRLWYLAFSADVCEEESLDWIIDMLEARCAPPSSNSKHNSHNPDIPTPGYLRTARLAFNGSADASIWTHNADIQRRVQVLRGKGMTIDLS